MPNPSASRLMTTDNKSTVKSMQPRKKRNYDVPQESSDFFFNLANSDFLASTLNVTIN